MKTVLCIASYEKGQAFLREAKRLGATVVLVTSESLKHQAQWPTDAIDELFYMPDVDHRWDRESLIKGVSWLAATRNFDRIVALDDFDVETAAALREHLRLEGLGDSAVRFFRDKLAMRIGAERAGIDVPDFVHVLNTDRLHAFLNSVPAPWVLKPRSMAGAIGIRKLNTAAEFWRAWDESGDMRSHYLLEQFVAGDIFHVDSLWHEGEPCFAVASGYGRPPMEVAHSGGIFTTAILDRGSEETRNLLDMNERVLRALGMHTGASHTEFIRSHADGRLLFLETSARVGGAHIAELVEYGTGINLWAEWARLELSATYQAPRDSGMYAGLLVSLARDEHPDTSAFNDPELVWRMNKANHVGFIVRSEERQRVLHLLGEYTERVRRDLHAAMPPKDSPDA